MILPRYKYVQNQTNYQTSSPIYFSGKTQIWSEKSTSWLFENSFRNHTKMATLLRISVDFNKQHRWHDRSRLNLFINSFTAWDSYWYIKQNHNEVSKTLMKKSSFNKNCIVFVGQENSLRTSVKLNLIQLSVRLM